MRPFARFEAAWGEPVDVVRRPGLVVAFLTRAWGSGYGARTPGAALPRCIVTCRGVSYPSPQEVRAKYRTALPYALPADPARQRLLCRPHPMRPLAMRLFVIRPLGHHAQVQRTQDPVAPAHGTRRKSKIIHSRTVKIVRFLTTACKKEM